MGAPWPRPMGAECGVECECEKEESTGQMYLTSLPMNTEEKAAEERRLVVQASTPVELHFTSPCEFTLHAYEANTVLEVLETRAEQIGLPKTAAAFLAMEFTYRSSDHCFCGTDRSWSSASMGCCAGAKGKATCK